MRAEVLGLLFSAYLLLLALLLALAVVGLVKPAETSTEILLSSKNVELKSALVNQGGF